MTEAEFDAILQQLLLNAIWNDVNPWGAWEYRNGAHAPIWKSSSRNWPSSPALYSGSPITLTPGIGDRPFQSLYPITYPVR